VIAAQEEKKVQSTDEIWAAGLYTHGRKYVSGNLGADKNCPDFMPFVSSFCADVLRCTSNALIQEKFDQAEGADSLHELDADQSGTIDRKELDDWMDKLRTSLKSSQWSSQEQLERDWDLMWMAVNSSDYANVIATWPDITEILTSHPHDGDTQSRDESSIHPVSRVLEGVERNQDSFEFTAKVWSTISQYVRERYTKIYQERRSSVARGGSLGADDNDLGAALDRLLQTYRGTMCGPSSVGQMSKDQLEDLGVEREVAVKAEDKDDGSAPAANWGILILQFHRSVSAAAACNAQNGLLFGQRKLKVQKEIKQIQDFLSRAQEQCTCMCHQTTSKNLEPSRGRGSCPALDNRFKEKAPTIINPKPFKAWFVNGSEPRQETPSEYTNTGNSFTVTLVEANRFAEATENCGVRVRWKSRNGLVTRVAIPSACGKPKELRSGWHQLDESLMCQGYIKIPVIF